VYKCKCASTGRVLVLFTEEVDAMFHRDMYICLQNIIVVTAVTTQNLKTMLTCMHGLDWIVFT
jgi:hypothetical protein